MILHYWCIQTNIFDYSHSKAYILKIADVLDGLFSYAKCQGINVKNKSYIKYSTEIRSIEEPLNSIKIICIINTTVYQNMNIIA